MNRFEGRAVVVAGGSGGVGAPAVRRIAAEGGDVAILYRSRADVAQGLADEVSKLGRTAVAVAADLTDRSTVDDAIGAAVAALGRLDAFISTVGVTTHMTPFLEVDDALIEHTIAVELVGAMHATRAVIPHLKANGGGHLVFVGSDSGKVGAGGEAVSAACRGGLISFVKSVAREFARDRVTANVVCPGPINTELWQALLRRDDAPSQRLAQGLMRGVPLRRVAEPEEVANVAVFLASPDASFVTGQAISASGGLTMC
jgi:NAD(P)-dependent dehydrogenase (short-subunit alcohol dehydrogenase family)